MDSHSIVQHYGILGLSSNPERAIPSDVHATDGALALAVALGRHVGGKLWYQRLLKFKTTKLKLDRSRGVSSYFVGVRRC